MLWRESKRKASVVKSFFELQKIKPEKRIDTSIMLTKNNTNTYTCVSI